MPTPQEVLDRIDLERGVTQVYDRKGRRIVVGSRVAGFVRADGRYFSGGVVTRITDPDGDVNDEGRPIGINPKVSVDYDDGTADTFSAYQDGWYGEWVCEDTDRLTPGGIR